MKGLFENEQIAQKASEQQLNARWRRTEDAAESSCTLSCAVWSQQQALRFQTVVVVVAWIKFDPQHQQVLVFTWGLEPKRKNVSQLLLTPSYQWSRVHAHETRAQRCFVFLWNLLEHCFEKFCQLFFVFFWWIFLQCLMFSASPWPRLLRGSVGFLLGDEPWCFLCLHFSEGHTWALISNCCVFPSISGQLRCFSSFIRPSFTPCRDKPEVSFVRLRLSWEVLMSFSCAGLRPRWTPSAVDSTRYDSNILISSESLPFLGKNIFRRVRERRNPPRVTWLDSYCNKCGG